MSVPVRVVSPPLPQQRCTCLFSSLCSSWRAVGLPNSSHRHRMTKQRQVVLQRAVRNHQCPWIRRTARNLLRLCQRRGKLLRTNQQQPLQNLLASHGLCSKLTCSVSCKRRFWRWRKSRNGSGTGLLRLGRTAAEKLRALAVCVIHELLASSNPALRQTTAKGPAPESEPRRSSSCARRTQFILRSVNGLRSELYMYIAVHTC